MNTPGLSVIAPLHDEEVVAGELAARCAAAAARTGRTWELIFVDDASADGTVAALEGAGVPLRLIRLRENRGQWGATRAGLARARGDLVVVLDGDLQDPPELIPRLLEAWDGDPETAVFAVKTRRDDPAWFRVGVAGYRLLQGALGAQIPRGAGSYSLLPRAVAARLSRLDLPDANLAAAVAALGVRTRGVPFERAARVDGRSRVGPAGLAREALGSLWLLSPPGRRYVAKRCGGEPHG